MIVASSAAVALALYPAVVGDGTGNFLSPPIYNEEQIPMALRPQEIVDWEGVITDTTDEGNDVTDEVDNTVDD